MFDWFEQQKALYNTLGPFKFAGLYLAIFAYLGACVWLLEWLSDETGWREAYGFSCHGRGCWLTDLWHSRALLETANGYEIALFALLWHLPVLAGTFIAVVLLRRKLKSHLNRIRQMDE